MEENKACNHENCEHCKDKKCCCHSMCCMKCHRSKMIALIVIIVALIIIAHICLIRGRDRDLYRGESRFGEMRNQSAGVGSGSVTVQVTPKTQTQ